MRVLFGWVVDAVCGCAADKDQSEGKGEDALNLRRRCPPRRRKQVADSRPCGHIMVNNCRSKGEWREGYENENENERFTLRQSPRVWVDKKDYI